MNIIRAFTKSISRVFSRLAPGGLGLGVLSLALAGCSFTPFHSSPKAQVSSLQLGTTAATSVTPVVLQAQVMRFADTYVATVAQACDDASARATNRNFALVALRWKLGQATSAYIDATGENPAVNALDLLVLATMARMVTEDYGVETYGDTIQPLLNAHRSMESNAWMLVSTMLKPAQQAELRDLIQAWREKNPHQHYIGPIRFREFVAALGKIPMRSSSTPNSIFSLLYLDPLAGLDPTAAAIQETRETAERAMYYTQRMPQLLSWQAEDLTYQLAAQPESLQMLSNAQQLATAAEIFAKTAQQLPQLINDQRQAAIQQILDGLTAGTSKSRDLLTVTHTTLDSASEAATNINAAVQSLTAFVHYVSPTNTSLATTATNAKPFNILDYGMAAAQIGAAANNLNTLLTTLNQTTPQLAQLQEQTAANANRVVDHAFRMGLVLILFLLAGSVVAGLAYRFLANRCTHRKPMDREP